MLQLYPRGCTDAGKIPIFALSADAFVEDERLSLKSGMNGHFAVPVIAAGAFQMVKAYEDGTAFQPALGESGGIFR